MNQQTRTPVLQITGCIDCKDIEEKWTIRIDILQRQPQHFFKTERTRFLDLNFTIEHRVVYDIMGMDKFTCGNIIDDLQIQTGEH